MEIPRLCAQPFSPISAWAVFSVFPKQAEWFKKKEFWKQSIIYQLCSFEQTTHLISLFLLPASSSPVPGIHNLCASDFRVQTPQMCATTPRGVWETMTVPLFRCLYLVLIIWVITPCVHVLSYRTLPHKYEQLK